MAPQAPAITDPVEQLPLAGEAAEGVICVPLSCGRPDPCWARIHDRAGDLLHFVAARGLSGGDLVFVRESAEGTDGPFADRVRSRCLRWAGENPDAFRREHGVEGAGELAGAIPDQELDRSERWPRSIRKLR